MRFEVGKTYGAYDCCVHPIRIIRRTERSVWVENDHYTWMMRVKLDADGNEIVTDSAVPPAWRECYTYSSEDSLEWEWRKEDR